MTSSAAIRAQVEARLADRVPAAFAQRAPAEMPLLPTGIATLDAAIGGIPCGGITEIVGPAFCSAGRKSLQAQLLAGATQERFCGLIDATDSFDPKSAESAGLNLHRLLWIRCGERGMKGLEQAFKATDFLLQGSGGFSLVMVDLAAISEKFIRKIPLSTWFRFSRVVERLSAPLVFITPCPVVGTCSKLTLSLSSGQVRWSQPARECPTHARVSLAFDFEVQIAGRRSFKRPPQPVRAFSAQRRWA
jgi:recombination protein RecA